MLTTRGYVERNQYTYTPYTSRNTYYGYGTESTSESYRSKVLGFSPEEYDRYVWRPARIHRGTYEVELV